MSKWAVVLIVLSILLTHAYYPKWLQSGTEATLSWDVSGYYMYLPAVFVYGDLRGCSYADRVLEQYGPTPDFQQAFTHEASGNCVMKYAVGQAVVLSPFFLIAHAWASVSATYPADGFSLPYQLCISVGTLLLALLGLLLLRRVLLRYFSDPAVAWTLVGITLGSNYLNYAAIDGAMTHNTLFTLYSGLLLLTVRFYEQPTVARGLGIGALVGLAALIRPTEIISCLLPLLWGLEVSRRTALTERLSFLQQHATKLVLAVVVCLGVGSLQLLYWKYVAGEWIVYSYQEQGFSWLRPHLRAGLFSYRSGWLTYSPFMIFPLLGFYSLWRQRPRLLLATAAFTALFVYITFAWDVWWYGGSLGQRAMVQAYPILAFPLCALVESARGWRRWQQLGVGAVALLFMYASLWFTHQAHRGGLLHVGEMRRAYYWKTLLTYEKDPEDLKLLDGVPRLYEGREPANVVTLYADTTYRAELNRERQFGPEVAVPITAQQAQFDWYRVAADVAIGQKEWDVWRMTQFIVSVQRDEQVIEDFFIRVQRLLNDQERRRLYLDFRAPREPFNRIVIKFWNGEGEKAITVRDVRVEAW